MVLLLVAGYVGAAVTVGLLWSYDPLVALVCAPFGASGLAGLVALVVGWRGKAEAAVDDAIKFEMDAALDAEDQETSVVEEEESSGPKPRSSRPRNTDVA